jgi:hypothetical protein
MNKFKAGDLVQVVSPKISYGDYEVGQVFLVDRVSPDPGAYEGDNLWCTYLNSDLTPQPNKGRVSLLYASEVELLR